MNAVYKWVHYVTLVLPPEVIQIIRFGALAIWLAIAVYISIQAWDRGKRAAVQEGKKYRTWRD